MVFSLYFSLSFRNKSRYDLRAEKSILTLSFTIGPSTSTLLASSPILTPACQSLISPALVATSRTDDVAPPNIAGICPL